MSTLVSPTTLPPPTPPPIPPPIPLVLAAIAEARAQLPPAQFRDRLRQAMVVRPDLTLVQVARQLGLTRQRVGQLVGKLERPTCAQPGPRPAPRRDEARRRMEELRARVAGGESAVGAARSLGISLAQARRLGFRVRAVWPPHGTQARLAGGPGRAGCGCWRCRRAGGIALPRGPKVDERKRWEVVDWLAWTDPDDGTGLTQARIGRLVGVGQPVVSRVALALGEGKD